MNKFLRPKKFLYQTVITTSLILGLVNRVLADSDGGNIAVTLINPLKVDSIEALLEAILAIIVVLATPVIVFFIIYAGFLYVTAQGNAEQVKQATRALTYAVIGGVIILGAVAIATIVKNLVIPFT